MCKAVCAILEIWYFFFFSIIRAKKSQIPPKDSFQMQLNLSSFMAKG